jgi:hypothetical protein
MIEIGKTPVALEVGNYLWSSDKERVKGRVELAFANGILYVSFIVDSKELKRDVKENNGPVYTDSCAEIFLMRKDGDEYTNFEFSASGAILIGHGSERQGRVRYDEEVLAKVKRTAYAIKKAGGNYFWRIDASIPLKEFDLDSDMLLGNAYFCGDGLEVPYYVSLFPVLTETPDFHRKEYFGPFMLRR